MRPILASHGWKKGENEPILASLGGKIGKNEAHSSLPECISWYMYPPSHPGYMPPYHCL